MYTNLWLYLKQHKPNFGKKPCLSNRHGFFPTKLGPITSSFTQGVSKHLDYNPWLILVGQKSCLLNRHGFFPTKLGPITHSLTHALQQQATEARGHGHMIATICVNCCALFDIPRMTLWIKSQWGCKNFNKAKAVSQPQWPLLTHITLNWKDTSLLHKVCH